MSDTPVTRTFQVRQQTQILNGMASFKADMTVLTAIVMRQDATLTAMQITEVRAMHSRTPTWTAASRNWRGCNALYRAIPVLGSYRISDRELAGGGIVTGAKERTDCAERLGQVVAGLGCSAASASSSPQCVMFGNLARAYVAIPATADDVRGS